MSQPGRPPVTTPFWIGDTVYKIHGNKNAGIVCEVIFQGDPAFPLIMYRVAWPKDCTTDECYGVELTKHKTAKTFTEKDNDD